ncbi:MAG: hypothetical protein KGO02_20310 [Alphaproteobacteria bacterium]|nr:hypothetical protein [Alphaproteobacteria bacterium]
MGRSASQINAATFGQFFGSLQIILGRFLVLQAARIFEQPNPRYPLRSIPSAIALLQRHSDRLVVEQRPGLIRALSRAGALPQELEALSDPELTRFVAEFFDRRMSDSHVEGMHNARALQALKTVRDKTVAHPEGIGLDQLPKSTFADIDRLVALAKAFLGAVGFGYLSTAYEDDNGHYFMSSDAKRSTVCLRRLLQKAGVIPDVNTHV